MTITDQRGLVILPYAKGFSERVANVLRGFNIKVAHKPIRTIRSSILKKPKDKIEPCTISNVKIVKWKVRSVSSPSINNTIRLKMNADSSYSRDMLKLRI